MTIGITGSGKGVSATIPELLTFPGPALVFDTKGELYSVTHEWRRKRLGHKIILLHPFQVCEADRHDQFNPLDLVKLLHVSPYEAACTIASLFLGVSQRWALM